MTTGIVFSLIILAVNAAVLQTTRQYELRRSSRWVEILTAISAAIVPTVAGVLVPRQTWVVVIGEQYSLWLVLSVFAVEVLFAGAVIYDIFKYGRVSKSVRSRVIDLFTNNPNAVLSESEIAERLARLGRENVEDVNPLVKKSVQELIDSGLFRERGGN